MRDQIIEKSQLLFYSYNNIEDIPILPGCFLLSRINALKKINGFDERFFMYMEDFDLCGRNLRNYRNVCFPEVSIIHKSFKESYVNYKLLLYHTISAFKYFYKLGWIFDIERREINKNIEVLIIDNGIEESYINFLSNFKNINYFGFVENPYILIVESKALVAPIFNGAGVKVKVIESLGVGTAVIDSEIAFE